MYYIFFKKEFCILVLVFLTNKLRKCIAKSHLLSCIISNLKIIFISGRLQNTYVISRTRYMSTRITQKRLLFSCNHVTISYLQMSCCTQIRFFVSVVIWFFVGIFWINLMVCYKGCCLA